MRSVASSFPSPFICLLFVVLPPAVALAAQARSYMEVSVQVVRADDSTAAAALIDTTEVRDSAGPAINSGAECKAIGNTVIVDDAWATCRWDPYGHVYLVTIEY